MKRANYTEGWHSNGNINFYVENEKIIRGVANSKTVYPYRKCNNGGYDNVSGIKAKYGILNNLYWF